ncbi:MAG: nucleotide exchange factor GrpE [Microcystaceae cyanobacterium]
MIDQPNFKEEQLKENEVAQSSPEEPENTESAEASPDAAVNQSKESTDTVSDGNEPSQPTSEEVIAALSQEVTTLQQQLETERQQGETIKNRYVTLAAEFDNFRKRTQKEKQELETQIKGKTLREILAVVDNFERARTQIKPDNDGEASINNSYQGVYKSLVDSLKRLGVSAMNPVGDPFDPMYHEAMLQEPTNEYPEGTVTEQLVRGYLLGEQVLRHAMVKVSVPSDDEESKSEEDSTANETAETSAN